jgi:hypothetical protein
MGLPYVQKVFASFFKKKCFLSCSFLKKRTKKLLHVGASACGERACKTVIGLRRVNGAALRGGGNRGT